MIKICSLLVLFFTSVYAIPDTITTTFKKGSIHFTGPVTILQSPDKRFTLHVLDIKEKNVAEIREQGKEKPIWYVERNQSDVAISNSLSLRKASAMSKGQKVHRWGSISISTTFNRTYFPTDYLVDYTLPGTIFGTDGDVLLRLTNRGTLEFTDAAGSPRETWCVPKDKCSIKPEPEIDENFRVFHFTTPFKIDTNSETLWSPKGKFFAKMTPEGSFSVFQSDKNISVAQIGKGGKIFRTTQDGRLQLVDGNNNEKWSSTFGQGVGSNGGKLILSDSGCLWLCRRSGNFVKFGVGISPKCADRQPCSTDTLTVGNDIMPGLQLTSKSGRFHAIMQPTGELEIRDEQNNKSVYKSNSKSPKLGKNYLVMPDGTQWWGIARWAEKQPIEERKVRVFRELPSSFKMKHTKVVLGDDGCLRHMMGQFAYYCVGTTCNCPGTARD